MVYKEEVIISRQNFNKNLFDYMGNKREESFKNFIATVYKRLKDITGIIGIIYDANLTCSFCSIKNIEDFLKNNEPTLLYLESKSTGIKVEIYEWELKYYEVIEDKKLIYIRKRDGEIINFFY